MTTTKRFRNKYTIQVRQRDHNPPHVHFFGGGYDETVFEDGANIVVLLAVNLKGPQDEEI